MADMQITVHHERGARLMADTQITVHYERKFSDGNYGSEGLSFSWTVTYEENSDLACDVEVVHARCREIAPKLRSAVLEELSKSGAGAVARAATRELFPTEPEPAAMDDDEYCAGMADARSY